MRAQNSPALSPAQVNSNLAPSPQHCEKDTHSVTLLLHLHSCWSLSLRTVFLEQTSQHQYFSYMHECRNHRDAWTYVSVTFSRMTRHMQSHERMQCCTEHRPTWTSRVEGPNPSRLRELRRQEKRHWAKMLTNIQDGIVHIETGNVTE